MCNPRKVMIHLTRAIAEAWRTTVEQTATAEDEVREIARLTVDIPLDAEMGDRALHMLERILGGEFAAYDAWDRDEQGHFRRELGVVTLVYQPGSRQLGLETTLTQHISAEAQAAAEASGFTVGEVAAEAVGRYYDDGWGGRTAEHARQHAQAEAEQRLVAATEALHRQQNAAELSAADAQALTEAQAQAAADLEQLRAETRAAMREQLQLTLAEAQDRVYRTMNRLVGEAYRRTLIEAVHENGGRILRDEHTGTMINLELELD